MSGRGSGLNMDLLRGRARLENGMRNVSYKGHSIELVSHRLRSGGWIARATVIINEADTVKM